MFDDNNKVADTLAAYAGRTDVYVRVIRNASAAVPAAERSALFAPGSIPRVEMLAAGIKSLGQGLPFSALTTLLVLAIWVALHPYPGIFHDARFYLVQAINDLDHRFNNDLYFAYGYPGQFTLFSLVYKRLVAVLGPPAANLVAGAAGQAVWLMAMFYFVRSLFGRGRNATFAGIGIILLYPYYGVHIFRYGEFFATPRLFAEALVLVSLALAFRGRLALAALPLIPALGLHPLMTLPGIAIVALLSALRHKWLWLAYAVVAGACLGLAALGVEPFTRAIERFDPQWFDIAYSRCYFAFITAWPWFCLIGPLANAAVLSIAWRTGNAAERRFIAIVSAVAAGGVLLTLLGGDIARDVLIVDLHPWRTLWTFALLSNAWTPIIALRLGKDWLSCDLLLIGMVCQAVVSAAEIRIAFAAPIFMLAAAAFAWEQRTQRPLRGALRYTLWTATGGILAVTVIALYFFVRRHIELPDFRQLAIGLAAAFAATVLLVRLLRVMGRPPRWVSLAAVGLVLTALVVVDRRDGWGKFMEDPKIPASLANFVGDPSNLYWEGGVELLWFKLQRPSYYSCIQGTGAQFFRGTAVEFERRSKALSILNTMDFVENEDLLPTACALKKDPDADGPHSREQIAAACRALPDLDAMVLMTRVPETTPATWRAPVSQLVLQHRQVKRIDTFYLYRCADFRSTG